MIILQSLTVAYVGEAEKNSQNLLTDESVHFVCNKNAINNSHLHIFASGAYTYLQKHNKHRCSQLRTGRKICQSANDERRVEIFFTTFDGTLIIAPISATSTLFSCCHTQLFSSHFTGGLMCKILISLNILQWHGEGLERRRESREKRTTDRRHQIAKKWRKACIPNKISQELNGIKLLMIAHSRMSKLLFASVAEEDEEWRKMWGNCYKTRWKHAV